MTEEDEDETLDLDDGEEEPSVQPNGGTSVVALKVPGPMLRYVVALQRTPPRDEYVEGVGPDEMAEETEEEVEARVREMDHISIEPEELRHIQETFNVHSIEEILETLKFKEEELIRIKSDFSIKMRNTLALQRIKFEKELNDMKKRMEVYDQFTKADEYIKKREDELKRKERGLEQRLDELEEQRLQMGQGVADGAGMALVPEGEAKDVAELREIIDEQALEVTQLESKLNRARAEMDEARSSFEKEKRRREEIETELDNLKKGSIAMMKYVTSMQRKKAEEEVVDLRRAVEEERKRREELEAEIDKKESALKARDVDVDKAISDAVSAGAKGVDLETIAKLNQEIRVRSSAIEAKEKDLKLKERKIVAQLRKLKDEREKWKQQEREAIDDRMAALPDFQKELMEKNELVRDLRSQLDVTNDELLKLRKAVEYKDEEFGRRQQELEYKEKLIEEETAKLKEAKDTAGGSEEVLTARKEVERLERTIASKEAELKTKEAFLANKERELQVKEQAVIQNNLKVSAQERETELAAKRVKTGTARLDDLLFGGLPLGSNVIITGPPFIGKEVLVESFVAEGLSKGVPAILILSDHTPDEMRAALANHISSPQEYEKLGLLKFIDAYSIPMGVEEEENDAIAYIKEATAYQDIIAATDRFTTDFKKEGHDYFRVIVASISTFITYSDVKATYGFLQKLTGRLTRYNAVSLYPIDEGMHTQTDIQMLGHVMDGSFQFKAENLKTYISIQGVTDVQSRDWIQYQYTKKGLNIGSFTLTHIR